MLGGAFSGRRFRGNGMATSIPSQIVQVVHPVQRNPDRTDNLDTTDITNTQRARLRALWAVRPVGVRVSLGASIVLQIAASWKPPYALSSKLRQLAGNSLLDRGLARGGDRQDQPGIWGGLATGSEDLPELEECQR